MTRDEATRIRISTHAYHAMGRRGVTANDVLDALSDPQLTTPTYENRTLYVRDGLAYVVANDDDRPVLITVLLRAGHQWTDEEVKNRQDRPA